MCLPREIDLKQQKPCSQRQEVSHLAQTQAETLPLHHYLTKEVLIYQADPMHHSPVVTYLTGSRVMVIEEMAETRASKIQD